ncbi:protein TASOR 2 isoform X2 [Nothobranchius furzeri]|uniref:Family with sequence similarity 208, member B n=1 Tax=Nothobranchius furzeri TaxID=105023 RepID=A0A1A8ATQ4_NOTFU|nr:uncharacterized protein tasor2 isoform X2 [Nothobranchius furzeri]
MESRNGGASCKGVLIPVAETSDIFQSTILAPLQSAYLYEESKQFFRYKSAVLVKNPELEQKYDSFRANRKNAGYSEDDLKESYGFLLFEDDTKANALGETGVLRGNSTCTTLGDPLKGVYLPMYSDCLDLNPWYHGKSGYIAIIRLTKGKVKKVVENYTQNFTEPTVGFDCHVSEHLPLVSAKTSSFLAFERTQYYIYELLNDGSNETALAPSAACPFAIVSFSYQDTKAVLFPQETSKMKELVCHYLPWRGQLQIGSQFYHVDLRSTTVAHVPVKLPPVVKVDRVTAISVLRRLLPRAVFDTCCTEEAFHDGIYCNLCEFVPSKAEENSSFAQLLAEIKEKDFAPVVQLNDGGFLILLHSSQFLRYDDTESPSSEVMQGLFVFPDSRVVRRDTKDGQKNHAMSNEILQLLPVLSFAEGEVEKRPLDSNRDVCEVLAQQMQRYATLINPGLSASPSRPSRELSIFPDQYDVGEAHKHLYSTPEWTNSSWQTFKSYFNKPTSFELPLSKVSEILTAGQEEQREDFDEDVYICLSSPEEAPASPVEMDLEDQFSDQQTPVNVALDMSSAESHVPTCDLQNSVLDNFQDEDDATDNQKMVDLIKLNETNHMKAKDPPGSTISDDIPAELIVSITSAERKVTNDNRSDISAVSRAKQRDFQFSDFSSISKMHKAEANSLSGKSNKVRNILISSEVAELTSAKPRQWQRRLSQVQKKVSKPAVKTGSVQTAVSTGEVNHLHCKKDKHAKESDLLTSSNNLKTNWRKLHRRKRRYGKPPSKNKKLRSIVSSVRAETKRTAAVQESVESTILMELEALPLKKKTERWDLKPVISECGRTLVPFGSVNISVVTKSSEVELQCTENDKFLEQMVNDVPEDAIDKIEKMNMSSAASEKAEDEAMATNFLEDENDLRSVVHVDQPVGGNGSVHLTSDLNNHSPKNDGTESSLLHAVENRLIQTLSPIKRLAKGEFLLSRLKSVLSRRKRKVDLQKEEMSESTLQIEEHCLKKMNTNLEAETSKCTDETPQNSDLNINNGSKMSVDPAFANYLGLTPRENQEKIKKTEDQDAQQMNNPREKEHTSLEKITQILQMPLSIYPRRKRIKMLKRHQSISEENVKKKWWLHFQTPACYTAEKVTHSDCSSDNTVRKTVEEKMKSACSSTDALNLLADLALSVSNGQVPPQPNQALEIIPKESMKCELTKALSSADHESVLHALLKNTAANAIQPLECPSPSPHVGNSELIGFISKEHNYSLPPSSSLLLDLPGATFQVQPLSGSTGLLNHHQSMHSNEVRTPQPSFIQEYLWENNRTPDYFHRHRQKFKHSRTFDFKDGSIQVTRKWQENYDFNLDSRFTSHPKDQVIIRALHGPCDFSSQDTSEEVRLIFHLWIGLFYSRSTSRFFQIDTSAPQHCFEEIKSLKKSSELVSGWTEHSTNSSDAFSSVTSTPDPLASEALDLRKKEDTLLEPDSEILDLSLRSSSEESVSSGLQINREVSSAQSKDFEALTNLKSTEESKEEETPKLCKTVDTEFVNEVNDDGNIESDKTETCQKDLWLNHEEAPPSKVDGAYFSQPEDISVNLELETASTVLGSDLVLHECNKATTFLKDSIENPQATKGLEQKFKTALPSQPKSVTDKILNSNSEESDLVHSTNVEGFKMKNGSCIEVNIDFLPDVIDTDGVSADRRLDIIRKGDYLVNEKLLSQETKADSPDYSEYLNGDVDCCERLEEFQNDCLREEKLDMKKTGYSTKVDIALICKHVPKTSDSPVKGDCTSENIDQAQMHDQLLPDNTNHGVNNLCANPVPLKDESSVLKDAAAEDNFKTIENSDQKPAFSDVSACTQDESPTVPCIPNQNDDIETENKTNASNLDFNLCCNDQKQETSPTEREEKTGEIIPEHSPSFDSEVVKICVPDKFSEKTYSKAIGTNGDGEKNWDGVVIPFLREDAADDHVLQLDEVEKAVKDQETIPFIKEATRPFDELPSAESSTLKSCDVKKKSPCSTTPQDNTETQKLEACESMSDSRSATPTIDEKPFEYMSSSPTSCTFTNGDHETCQDVTLKCPSRNSTLVIKELSFEKILQPSTANNDSPIASSICGPHSDVKQRTLRLLESINDYISTGCDIPHQIKAADIKSPDPLNISVKKCPPTCLELSSITVDVTNQRAGNEPHPDMSSFSSQDLYPKLTDGISLPIKTISEEVPNVKLQMNEKSSTSKHYLKRSYRHQTSVESEHQSYGYLTSVEGFQDENKTTLHYKSRSHTHHAVMAVGLNKSVESQTQQLSKDNHVETTSRNKKPRIHITEKSSATSTLLKKTKKHILKKQGRLRYRTGHLTGQNRRNDFSDKPFTYEDNVPRGQDSIVCTIFNTSLKKSYCVLDQLSQRSLPDDPTQASIDQERLIFSEQMKNLLRKSKSGPVCQQNVFDSLKQSCNNPLIVNFSNLEEQEDSLEFWDTQYVRQKIMVDMTDRKCLTESTKGKNMLQDFSQETSIPGETAKISEIIAEGARMYETKMCDVCSVKKTSSRSKRVYCGYSRTKPRNHFDFCDQMKKELDKTFLSNLNAVVKKSSKTKYRFYLLVTSDDVFFKETKAYLDAESHTAVPPCEFFSDEDNPACLLIILRNEDIAEHICKIPHLLRLKMTPGVQFAGIDEPDDIVNLTYQELFTRGGFIMLDRAVLESLSLCNMKLISDILQELNRIEKWKWMMHYRDSRRLKENARLSGEANEKKHFLNWGQDAGILEVLPYHECDSLSRDQPDYVACLHRLQIQHISSRYPVFVTDDTSHSAFEENGIFTMTLNTFLKKSATEIFPI